MKQSFQKKYNDSINLISHLILTKPKPVIGLLAKHGVVFKGTPSRNQIIDEVVELLKSDNGKFEADLGNLLTVHIQYQGKEMLSLEQSDFSSYDDGDQDEDAFWGALAKGAIGIVGGLFKKKRRRRSSGGGNAALAASQAVAQRQAAQAKRDMQLQMQRMRESAARRAREAEERRAREAEERRRREEEARRQREREAAAKKKQTNTMLMAGGGIALLAIVGFAMAKSNSPRQTAPYVAPQPISNR